MNGYVGAGYLVTFLSLAAYSLRVLTRGRALAQSLHPDRPWK